MHGATESFDSRLGRAQREITVSPLLEQPAVLGVKLLEACEGRQRCIEALQVALSDREHVEDVAVLRDLRQQALRGSGRRRELAPLEHRADAHHFRIDTGGRRVGCCGGHGRKKGGQHCPPLILLHARGRLAGACSLGPAQNLYPNFTPRTRGRITVCVSIAWEAEVNTMPRSSVMFVP